jgi:hypothetical protein
MLMQRPDTTNAVMDWMEYLGSLTSISYLRYEKVSRLPYN